MKYNGLDITFRSNYCFFRVIHINLKIVSLLLGALYICLLPINAIALEAASSSQPISGASLMEVQYRQPAPVIQNRTYQAPPAPRVVPRVSQPQRQVGSGRAGRAGQAGRTQNRTTGNRLARRHHHHHGAGGYDDGDDGGDGNAGPSGDDGGTENAKLFVSIANQTEFPVQVEFYAQGREAAWPGDGLAWDLASSNRRRFGLTCMSGEKICYGAWYTNNPDRHWGVGSGGEACTNCCYTCGAGTNPVNLTDQ